MIPEDYDMKATRAIASAKLLLADGDMEGACNRTYYAMFDAAHAALLRSGAQISENEIKTHSGLIGAFGKHLVKTGLVSSDLGRSFNQVEQVRLLADYTGDPISVEKATWALTQAEVFLESLGKLRARDLSRENDLDSGDDFGL